jgi:putative CocE/NonD family hydrolase
MMIDDARNEIVIERNLVIPLSDGASLSADLYRPAGSGRFPALMSFYPYHKDDMIGAPFEGPRRYFAANGYAHLLIDFRGLGGSDGIAWEAMHRSEGVDGAQACEWIANQSWCDGNVGMWGLSYGGISSLKVAAENPPHLKAIIPIQGSANIYADYIAPGGCRSLLGSYGAWGSFMLAMNLMPPTNTDADGRWYRVWIDRMERGAPYVLPWFDHPDFDEYWSAKAVDASRITIPTFIIGGWRDIFPEGMPALYPQIKGPKKLLMGPWMHGLPDGSPYDAIEFLPEMKRWFDHFVRGEKNGIELESPVTINVQNSRDGTAWRHEREWPIARAKARTLFLGRNGTLQPNADREEQGENYRADPTIGSAAGLWDPMALGVGLPQDQTEDDMKSLAFTSEPLAEDLEISGAPEAVIHAAIVTGDDANIVAKLCDVDPDGGSALITTGWLKASHRSSLARREKLRNNEAYEFKIALWSTAYRVPKGHSIRLSVSCSDFPHLWPDARKPELRVFFGGNRASSISLPAIPASSERPRGMEIRPPAAPPPPSTMRPIWKIERDLAANAVTVTTGETNTIALPQGGAMSIDHVAVAKVSEARPDAASVQGNTTMAIDLHGIGNIKVHTQSRVTQTGLLLNATVSMDDKVIFEKRWIK